jgi:DNA-binding response OmpR family regulator
MVKKPKPPTVMVIDDDADFVALVTADLEAAGYRVIVGYDAMQGFMIAQRELPRVILLDLQLPGGGGLQVLQRLAKSAKTLEIPVAMVTASTDAKLEAETKKLGARGYLRKPIDRKALLDLVQALLERPS